MQQVVAIARGSRRIRPARVLPGFEGRISCSIGNRQ